MKSLIGVGRFILFRGDVTNNIDRLNSEEGHSRDASLAVGVANDAISAACDFAAPTASA